ncbi:helix-turn-helix domain-containing protein [Pseudenhygromyxa sp. WMMC2535]|uniref:helix-turn-helix domain-containing protein n=1 Tax=Pseudenhygromyxa sp. WMMC2535 TaxID=2712867 RepID=UPI001553D878|nr:helix-turn-helix domain-containing protein [Pseudenhygromyxa sp. WMMC2535]NVB41412.1 helix-turn-helix domain-containing protein [Pseudenhygromyxa sp. WMMC2535]
MALLPPLERGEALRLLLTAAPDPQLDQRCLSSLKIDSTAELRVVASSAREAAFTPLTTTIDTPFGTARASVVTSETETFPHAAGLGLPVLPTDLRQSWEQAVTAIRLSSPEHPRIDYEHLGVLAELVPLTDRQPPHPDIAAIAALPMRDQDLLETLVAQPSVRATATALGLHHSSVQQRLDNIEAQLGLELRSPSGRFRLSVAVLMTRAMQFRFPALDDAPR